MQPWMTAPWFHSLAALFVRVVFGYSSSFSFPHLGGSGRMPFKDMRVYVQKAVAKQKLQNAIRSSGATLTWTLPKP